MYNVTTNSGSRRSVKEIVKIRAVAFVAFVGVGLSAYLCFTVLSLDEGTPDMQEVSHAIREGANGFLTQQSPEAEAWHVEICIPIAGLQIRGSKFEISKFKLKFPNSFSP